MESLVTCSSLQLPLGLLGLVKVVEVSEGHKIFKGMSRCVPFAWQIIYLFFFDFTPPPKRGVRGGAWRQSRAQGEFP